MLIRLNHVLAALLMVFGPSVSAMAGTAQAPQKLEDLRSLEKEIQTIAPRCSAATVSLTGDGEGGTGTGSGVVVTEEGLILTAAHVLAALGDEVKVSFPDGREVTAIPLGADYDRDAAMLKIQDEGEYPFVSLGDSKALDTNQWCLALGHPGGFDPDRAPPLRLGRILVNGDFVLSDCTVVGGDSGGPLFDTEGRLIGIHSSIGFTLSENRHVPVSLYKESWEDLESGKSSGDRFAAKPGCRNPDCKNCSKASDAEDASDEKGASDGDELAEVDEDGRDALDRFLDDAMDGSSGQMQLRLTPADIQRFGGIDAIMARVKTRTGGVESEETTDEKADATKAADVETDASASSQAAESDSSLGLLDLLAQSRENGGKLEVSPEKLEQLGGLNGLMKQMQDLGLAGDLSELSGVALPQRFAGKDTFYEAIVQTLQPVVKPASSSVATVLVDDAPVSLATVVSSQGHLLAPSSHVTEGALTVKIGDRVLAATVEDRFPRYDLALLKTDASDLVPVEWATDRDAATAGTLLSAPGAEAGPLGLGLISVEARSLLSKGFLGVATVDVDEGALVKTVTPDSPAARAGIKEGDVIHEIAGEFIREGNIGKVVQAYGAGDSVEIKYQREDESMTCSVALAPRDISTQPKRFRMMNRMSGPLSERQSGFPEALQHDMPLTPEQCGGPLVDLDGRCVGINVSRAGRVKTLAIPAASVRELIEEAVNGASRVERTEEVSSDPEA